MLKNLQRVSRKKTRELRPRTKGGLERFGSSRVGVRKSTVDVYDV